MKKLLTLLLLSLVMISCEEFTEESDFRNYLRDKHPYCEMKRMFPENRYDWMYKVNDTIKGEIWLYKASQQRRAERESLNCF